MRLPTIPVLIAGLTLAVTGVVSAGGPAADGSTHPVASVNIPMATVGQGSGTPHTVDARALPPSPQHGAGVPARQATAGDADTARWLPVLPSRGTKPAGSAAAGPVPAGGINGANGRHPAAIAVRPFVAPTSTDANFDGISFTGQNCGFCIPPNATAAVSPTQIAETVNAELGVYDKVGNPLCPAVDLHSLLGADANLQDMQIQYDNLDNRFSMIVTFDPTFPQEPAALYVAVSATGDACGSWLSYHLTFTGGSYPPGADLDRPHLGQDQGALLVATDNFDGTAANTYVGSAAFSIPKSRIYNNLPVSFTSFGVAMSTTPVRVAGIPIEPTAATYFISAIPGTGYKLFRMTNSAGPATTLTLQATISSPYSAPPRQANQPLTTTTLNPGSGLIDSAPVQAGNGVWFTHGVAIGTFPGVRYGAINMATNTATVAIAYHSSTSDDFDPSIGVTDVGAGQVRIWLNWAYTDTPAGVAASDTVDGVLPGGGVPNLIGTGLVLVNGHLTTANNLFDGYSSVAVDPSADVSDTGNPCPAGLTAVTAQQYFTANGDWATRIGRLSFC